jgi:hypothetical protein
MKNYFKWTAPNFEWMSLFYPCQGYFQNQHNNIHNLLIVYISDAFFS